MSDSWLQGIALVLIAIVLEAVVDILMDKYKIVNRSDRERSDRHPH